jgi:hypothetical protein
MRSILAQEVVMQRTLAVAVVLCAGASLAATACSGVVLFGDGKVVVGGNEDQVGMFTNPAMWATAATDQAYGAVFFGLWFTNLGDRQPGWYEMQGVNDHGLYFDLFATPCPPGTLRPVQRPYWWKPEPLEQLLLRRCATVKEALGFLSGKGYRWSVPCTQVLLVDRSGNTAVYTDTGTVFRNSATAFFVVTNFDLATPALGDWPCPRYETLTTLVTANSNPTVDRAASLLAAVGDWALYSVVCDLSSDTVDVYFNTDFSLRARVDMRPLFAEGLSATPLAGLAFAPSGIP